MREVTPLQRKLFSEFMGSALVVTAIVGASYHAQVEKAAGGITLLYIDAAVALTIFALITLFGPLSGAHFNPVVTLTDALFGRMTALDTVTYILAQVAGGMAGIGLSAILFDREAYGISTVERLTTGQLVSELVGTVGLLMVVFCLGRSGNAAMTPAAVTGYISAVVLFTSTAFLNPQVTIARMFTPDSVTGIDPVSALWFVVMQVAAALIAVPIVLILYPQPTDRDEVASGRLRRLAARL